MELLEIPEINVDKEELKLLLAIKLFEEGKVSLGKAAEIAGFTEKTFSEILLKRKTSPIKYQDLNLQEEIDNA